MTADTVRALASLLDVGMPARAALRTWAARSIGSAAGDIARVARRVDLGEDLVPALAALESQHGSDARFLRVGLAVHERVGGNAAETLEALARGMDERRQGHAAARAAAATARVSGRVIAALPVLLVPAVALAGAPVLDPIGIAFLAVGVALAAAGLVWIDRMMPRPPTTDGAAMLGDLVAGGARAGVDPATTLRVAAELPPEGAGPGLLRMVRLLDLGMDLPDALRRCGDPALEELGRRLTTALDLGLPVADSMSRFARGRARAGALEHERRLRRSAVVMVIPVSVCVLPAYFLLVMVPFLRGLSW